MTQEITSIIARNRATLIGDAIGACALLVLLFVGLSLPGLA